MQKTAKAITLFEVTSFEPEMRQMGDIILRCAELTVEAVGLLGSHARERRRASTPSPRRSPGWKSRPTSSTTPASRRCSCKHRDGNAMAFIVGDEIYDHLEKVVDRFEDVANRISGILIEQV